MKIQCSCGAKYEFDITPAMVNNPVRFICPACGVDASEFVDGLVRRELGQAASPPGVPQSILPVAAAAPPAAAPLHVQPAAAPESDQGGPVSTRPPLCPRHYGQVAVEKCYVCSKPLCPKCMELFGYVCSPLCRTKAEARGITIPVFAGQKSVVQARYWRKVGGAAKAAGALLLAVLGLWFWYAWFGSQPKAVFSVRFPEPAYSGRSFICDQDQLVYLHGGTLARYDLKQKKAVWSRELLDPKQLAEQAAAWLKQLEAEYSQSDSSFKLRPPPVEKLTQQLEKNAAAALQLYVRGQNVWIASSGKLVRYDWATGTPVKELAVGNGFGRLMQRGDELLMVETDSAKPCLTQINLTTCDIQTEEPNRPAMAKLTESGDAPPAVTNLINGRAKTSPTAGLPTGMPGKDAGKAMDPAKVAEQAQRLSYPARLALPATLAVNRNQERALAELNSDNDRPTPAPARTTAPATDQATLIPDRDGFIQCGVRLLESHITERSAVKARPAKSALDNLTAGNSTDAANEILNEMQRDRGGDKLQEDESRYLVTLRRPGQSESWSGEVVGPPALYPLPTVNVLAANKSIVVLDKSNHKLWQSSLNFNVRGGLNALESGASPDGQGPCVERGNSLYVFDEGVLTAFDLHTGNARWRLPSVGIAGLFFDDHDMLYVNTTTAGPDTLKYSRQIDITQKTERVVLKVDTRDGRVLWDVEPGGFINYVSGKFLYTVSSYQPDETDEDNPYTSTEIVSKPAFLRIRRISPRNGKMLWEHGEDRAPLDIQFDKNTIRLVFKKEVEVLRFLSF